MATIVASRFAVLSVDDDDDDEDNLYTSTKRKNQSKKMTEKCSNPVPAKLNLSQKKKKKQEIQVPVGRKKSQKNPVISESVKAKKGSINDQWDDWNDQNAELTEENFDKELSEAILLSKLEYDQKNAEVGSSSKKNEKSESAKRKKKTPKGMAANEINQLVTNSGSDKNIAKVKAPKTELKPTKKPEPFSSLPVMPKANYSPSSSKDDNESTSQESLTLVLYQASMDKKDREIDELKAEIERLNTQVKNVKLRNTKLCQIIASGEMKDKAEVLMEVERLQTIKDELSAEVAILHSQLEQERSKVRQLMAENKNKSKKHQ